MIILLCRVIETSSHSARLTHTTTFFGELSRSGSEWGSQRTTTSCTPAPSDVIGCSCRVRRSTTRTTNRAAAAGRRRRRHRASSCRRTRSHTCRAAPTGSCATRTSRRARCCSAPTSSRGSRAAACRSRFALMTWRGRRILPSRFVTTDRHISGLALFTNESHRHARCRSSSTRSSPRARSSASPKRSRSARRARSSARPTAAAAACTTTTAAASAAARSRRAARRPCRRAGASRRSSRARSGCSRGPWARGSCTLFVVKRDQILV